MPAYNPAVLRRFCETFYPKTTENDPAGWCILWKIPFSSGMLLESTTNVNQTISFMLRWTITFLIIALVAAVFGFTGIAAGAAEIAKIIFYIFLVVFVISLIAGAFRRTD
jgi:uncharacterized membrane protein YtjA (UPF0391 family)